MIRACFALPAEAANALFAVNLNAIGKPHGVGAFSAHLGDVITDLTRNMLTDEIRASGFIDEQGRPISDPARNIKTAEQGGGQQAFGVPPASSSLSESLTSVAWSSSAACNCSRHF
jgi:hypothetical protein